MTINSTQEQAPTRESGTETLTVLGLGMMGHALAKTFQRNGYRTVVWNRTATKAADLVEDGATLAESARDAVAAGRLLIVCLSDYDSVHEILDPLDGALDGRVLVNLTSGTSAQARQTAEWAARQGCGYLDGAILGVPAAIGSTDAEIIYSGPRAAFDTHEKVLQNLGRTTYLGADHGLSSLHDVAILNLMWGILNAFLHSAALLGAAGVRADAFAPLATRGVGTVGDWLTGYAQQIDARDYPVLDATIHTHVATMEHVVEECEAAGVSAEIPRFVKTLADRAVSAGRGDEGYAALIELFRKDSVTPR